MSYCQGRGVKMVSYYFCHMGRGGEFSRTVRLGGFIAIGYPEFENANWMQDTDFEQTKAKLGKGGYAVGQMWIFVHINDGDVVLVPDPQKKSVLLCRTVGNYYFEQNVTGLCEYKHRRKIELIKEIPRSRLSEKLRNSLGSLLAVGSLDDHREEIELLISDSEEDIEEGQYNIPVSERRIITKPSDPTIKDLCERIDKNRLVVRPEFQREYVWDDKPKLKSRLVESVLLDLPIPVIYTAEEQDGKEIVIDGQQRILTLYHFRNKQTQFKLTGLEVLSELNGYTYSDLGNKSDEVITKISKSFGDLQERIDEYPLHFIKILKDSQEDIKFDVFERLNRGSVKLTEQELRNCIYRGNFNSLLRQLVQNRDFLSMQGLDKPDPRMKDVERLLRFFAFCERGEKNYKSPLKKFLNDYMKSKRTLSEKELTEKERLFRKCVEICQTVFGEHAFRKVYVDTENNHALGYESNLNEGVFDVQMYCFMEYEKRDVIERTEVIKDAFYDVVSMNQQFIDTIEKGTYDTERVKRRIEIWHSRLREIIGYPKNDRRLYTFEEKRTLYEMDPICSICKNKISVLADAHVDHIQRYSEGGVTSKINGQLTHRFCNLHKN